MVSMQEMYMNFNKTLQTWGFMSIYNCLQLIIIIKKGIRSFAIRNSGLGVGEGLKILPCHGAGCQKVCLASYDQRGGYRGGMCLEDITCPADSRCWVVKEMLLLLAAADNMLA